MNTFPAQEPRPRPDMAPHSFIMGKVATQCARCYLREHNEIHTPPPDQRCYHNNWKDTCPSCESVREDIRSGNVNTEG